MNYSYSDKFYVYIYYDLNGIPFYVGKGHGDRAYAHLKNARDWKTKDRNTLKLQTIREILDRGQTPSIKFVELNLTESEAKDLERELIKQYGRRNNNTGTLTNLTDGGDGKTGHCHSPASKLKISKAPTSIKFPTRESIIPSWVQSDSTLY